MPKREDPLKDSWAYQEILQEGEQRALQEELRRQRQAILFLVRKNFPTCVELARERTNAIDRPGILQDIILRLFNTDTEGEARRILSL